MKKRNSLDKEITQALYQEGNLISASGNLKNKIDRELDSEIESKIINLSESRKVKASMKKPNIKFVAAAVIAVCVLIPTGVYAGGKITGYASSTYITDRVSSYAKLDKMKEKAGFDFYAPESFSNGYAFSSMDVSGVDKLDEHNNRVGNFPEWWGSYTKKNYPDISLVIHEFQTEQTEYEAHPTEERTIGDVSVSYTISHYKFVPVDYTLTAEDEEFEKQPNCYISVGSSQIEETDYYNINWIENGLYYNLFCNNSIMDTNGSFTPAENCEDMEGLFRMAEEIILQ